MIHVEGFPAIISTTRETFVFKAHRLCVSLNSRLESNEEDEEEASQNSGPIACLTFAHFFGKREKANRCENLPDLLFVCHRSVGTVKHPGYFNSWWILHDGRVFGGGQG